MTTPAFAIELPLHPGRVAVHLFCALLLGCGQDAAPPGVADAAVAASVDEVITGDDGCPIYRGDSPICAAAAEKCSRCGRPTFPCGGAAFAVACRTTERNLSEAGRAGWLDCFAPSCSLGTDVPDCYERHLASATPSGYQREVAQEYCSTMCAEGDPAGCERRFYGNRGRGFALLGASDEATRVFEVECIAPLTQAADAVACIREFNQCMFSFGSQSPCPDAGP